MAAIGGMTPGSPRGGLAPARALAMLLLGYGLVANSHHVLLPGVPLSLATAAVAGIFAACLALPAPMRPTRWRWVAVVAVVVGLKLVASAALPARGFVGEYFLNDRFEGQPHRRADARLHFEPGRMRLEFLNDAPEWRSGLPDRLPFSVRWTGTLETSGVPLTIATQSSLTVVARVDDGPPPPGPSAGLHRLELRAAGTGAPRASLALDVREPAGPLAVWAPGATAAGITAARWYRWLAVVLDAGVLVGGLAVFVMALAAAAHRSRALRWAPPLPLAAVGVVAFWFVVGALRTAMRWDVVEFLERGDDWVYFEALARRIAAGDLLGGTSALFSSSFTYLYYLGGLHVLFGEAHWPAYFAQYVTLGVACAVLGVVAGRLWDEHVGLLTLGAATAVGVLDVARWYPVRFLSENVALVVVAVTFLVLHRYLERPTVAAAVGAGAVLGLAALTRTNFIPFAGVALLYLVARRDSGAPDGRAARRIALAAACVAVYALLPLRERIVSGYWTLLPQGTVLYFTFTMKGSVVKQWNTSWTSVLRETVIPNIAFMLGYPKLLVHEYSIRPHWVLLWVGYAVTVWRAGRDSLRPPVLLLHAFVWTYIGVLVISPVLTVYGFRHLLGLVFVLALFFAQAVRPMLAREGAHE